MADTARRFGGMPVPERSGHAFIRTRMIAEQAPFGAEISGHYFYGELDGGDDGLFTACRLIRYLDGYGQSLADLCRACPPVFVTPDLRLPIPNRARACVLEHVRTAFAQYPQSFVDGIRIEFPTGWALIRGSVTEAKITFRFEGSSPERLSEIVREFCTQLPEWGPDLHKQYQMARSRMQPGDETD
jgi:phosphomannomutase/phosphoglucomutase